MKIKKAYRVKSEKDFSAVYHQGKKVANRQFVLYYLPKEQAHFRLGISCGKKIGNAVKRNYVKRRIRESFKELEMQIRPNFDIIIIARKPSGEMTFAQIKSSISHVLSLTELLKSK